MAWPPSMPSSDASRPRLKLALDVVGGERQRQAVGIARDHPAGDVELLQLHLGVPAVLDLAGDVDRPELRADLALRRAGQIGVPGRRGAEVVGRHVARSLRRLADRPGQVVVPVDQRGRAEQLAGVLERGDRSDCAAAGAGIRTSRSGEGEGGRELAELRRATSIGAPLTLLTLLALRARPICTSSGRTTNSGQIVRSYS